MKIDPLSQPRSVPVRRKERSSSLAGNAFARELQGGLAMAGVSGGGPLGAVDALLSLQEVPEAATGQAQARERGERLLDELEDLRLSLLSGEIPVDQLLRLSDLLAARKGCVADPRLADILEQIEIRAAVELAKLGR